MSSISSVYSRVKDLSFTIQWPYVVDHVLFSVTQKVGQLK